MSDRAVSGLRTLCCVLSLAGGNATAAEPPRHVAVSYQVSWNGMAVGRSTETMEHDGARYKIVSDLRTTGLAAVIRKVDIHVESHGLIAKGALQPIRYSEDRTKKPRRSASFDWQKRQMTLDSGQGPHAVNLPDHPVFDRASFAWSFAFQSPPVQEGKIGLTDGRKLSIYRYVLVGRETIKTPAGRLETLRVRKVQEAGDDRTFEVWLATQQHYLPARILFQDDNDTVDSVVSAIDIPSKP